MRDKRTTTEILNRRQPDIQGDYGNAWFIPYIPQPNDPPSWQAHLCRWIIESNSFHPAWNTWVLSAISLKDFPDVPPAAKAYPEATVEFITMAIQPTKTIDLADTRNVPYLSPLDLECQVHGVTDDQVGLILKHMAHLIVTHGVSPDSDNRRFWEGSIKLTATHYREGHHDFGFLHPQGGTA